MKTDFFNGRECVVGFLAEEMLEDVTTREKEVQKILYKKSADLKKIEGELQIIDNYLSGSISDEVFLESLKEYKW